MTICSKRDIINMIAILAELNAVTRRNNLFSCALNEWSGDKIMDAQQAAETIHEMRTYAENKGLGLLLAGSAGYRSVLLHPSQFAACDDLDGIFIYDKIDALEQCPYLSAAFLRTAAQAVGKDCDMFSTKTARNQIKLSLDFVSLSYLQSLGEEPVNGQPVCRVKLTDAEEKNFNRYCDCFGREIVYQKPCAPYNGYRLYTLPIYLYDSGNFFPGVLLNKYLYNPACLCSVGNQESCVRRIQERVRDACPPGGSVENTCYHKQAFSVETRNFLEARR